MGSVSVAATLALGAAPASATFWEKFRECPVNNPETALCVYAQTVYNTSTWEKPVGLSQLVAGDATVPFHKPLALQGGVRATVLEQEEELIDPEGAPVIKPVPETVPGGLRAVIDESKLAGAALAAFKAAASSTEGRRVTATIEAAPFAPVAFLNARNILEGHGPGMTLPLKVKFNNSFLGTECYAGSDASPVVVELTSGTTSPPEPYAAITGQPGVLTESKRSEYIKVKEDSLVSNTFTAPAVEGCGSEPAWHGEVDEAINTKVGLPTPPGASSTRINGALYMAPAHYVREHLGL